MVKIISIYIFSLYYYLMEITYDPFTPQVRKAIELSLDEQREYDYLKNAVNQKGGRLERFLLPFSGSEHAKSLKKEGYIPVNEVNLKKKDYKTSINLILVKSGQEGSSNNALSGYFSIRCSAHGGRVHINLPYEEGEKLLSPDFKPDDADAIEYRENAFLIPIGCAKEDDCERFMLKGEEVYKAVVAERVFPFDLKLSKKTYQSSFATISPMFLSMLLKVNDEPISDALEKRRMPDEWIEKNYYPYFSLLYIGVIVDSLKLKERDYRYKKIRVAKNIGDFLYWWLKGEHANLEVLANITTNLMNTCYVCWKSRYILYQKLRDAVSRCDENAFLELRDEVAKLFPEERPQLNKLYEYGRVSLFDFRNEWIYVEKEEDPWLKEVIGELKKELGLD
jgi:hypothetical protein